MNNTFGNRFRLTISGGSHAENVAVAIDGVPAGISLEAEDFLRDIRRRKSGATGTTPRVEDDMPQFESGVDCTGCGLVTTGEQVRISFANNNIRPQDYEGFRDRPRPGHADFVAFARYGSLLDGFFSGRMTLPLVAAGVIAKKMIAPVSVEARLVEVGGVAYGPDSDKAIEAAMADGDSLGGIIECVCSGVPVGLGEPFFDSVESLLSHAMFSIPGIRGVEFGDGFTAAGMRGSEHNDPIVDASGRTAKNGCGGINGGLTNGNPLVFRIAVKPTSSIAKAQCSYDSSTGEMASFSVPGRHDCCFALRVPPVVEALTACVLAELIASVVENS